MVTEDQIRESIKPVVAQLSASLERAEWRTLVIKHANQILLLANENADIR